MSTDRSKFKHVCLTCKKRFETPQGKYQHVKKHCKGPTVESIQDKIKELEENIVLLRNSYI